MASFNSRTPIAKPLSRPPGALVAQPNIPPTVVAEIRRRNLAAIRRYAAGEPIPDVYQRPPLPAPFRRPRLPRPAGTAGTAGTAGKTHHHNGGKH